MAVPNDNFGLVDVVTEIDKFGEIILKVEGEGGRLTTCFFSASDEGFVGGAPATGTNLSDFAGYEQPNPTPPEPDPTVYQASLGYYPSNSADACTQYAFNIRGTYYTDDTNFYISTKLYNNNTNPLEIASSGYYAADFGWRYWDSTTQTFTDSGSCGGGL